MPDYCIPRLRLHLATRSGNQEAPLSKTEKQIGKVLSKTDSKTIFGKYIHIALCKKTSAALRGIISELKDQLRDAPNALKDVIGEEGIQLLEQL